MFFQLPFHQIWLESFNLCYFLVPTNVTRLEMVKITHRVSWVRDNGAEYTGDVTSCECDDELFALGALGSGFWHDVLVDQFDGTFEACELHHGVGDLPEP